jgi:hypothetical protein
LFLAAALHLMCARFVNNVCVCMYRQISIKRSRFTQTSSPFTEHWRQICTCFLYLSLSLARTSSTSSSRLATITSLTCCPCSLSLHPPQVAALPSLLPFPPRHLPLSLTLFQSVLVIMAHLTNQNLPYLQRRHAPL